jgi:hypothetical protein
MRIVMFYHSLLSDWNHGNAHFLRGVVRELLALGQEVRVYDPANAWSLRNLITEHGRSPVAAFRKAYPLLDSIRYDPAMLDLDAALDEADLVLVHEWNEHELVHRIGRHRATRGRYRLLFHDTHHRAITQPDDMAHYDLTHCDAVLAFGRVLRDLYLKRRWTRSAWTWHEAADGRTLGGQTPIPHCPTNTMQATRHGTNRRATKARSYLPELYLQKDNRIGVIAAKYMKCTYPLALVSHAVADVHTPVAGPLVKPRSAVAARTFGGRTEGMTPILSCLPASPQRLPGHGRTG